MNNLSIYNEIVKSRGLRKLDYQEEFLTSEYNSTKPFVLAAGTSSGKTFMAIMKLEIFYSYAENKNKRTLIIPYAMKVLRDNFSTELSSFKPSFTYCVATTKEELVACLKSDCQVVVALPQALSNSVDLLPKFHNFIIDEAHQWYSEKTIQGILKKIKPKYQLLLTGTPARFNAKRNDFNFQYVPVMHLFGLNQVTNVRIEVVSSTYDFKQSDYIGSYGNLKEDKITEKDTDEALIAVCDEMLKRIKNPIKQPNLSRVTKDVFNKLGVFNHIGKTIIFCHSVNQADAIYNSLNGFKDLTGKVLVSHSKNDPNSENFITFKDDDSYSILVAVDRGKLGFNIPQLCNVVDFTLTQSLDMLMQMFGRVLRLSDNIKDKTYYKVATKNTAPYYVDLMSAMLSLTDMKWYSKYNGKNMDEILIPRVLTNSKSKSTLSISKPTKKTAKPKVSLADLGVPLDMKLFKSVYYNHNDKFGTVSFTTLGDCKRTFFEMNTLWDKEKILKEALKYKTKTEFHQKNQSALNAARRLQIVEEVTAHMNKRYTMNKENCIEISKKCKTTKEFIKEYPMVYSYARRHNILEEITSHMIKSVNRWDRESIISESKKYNSYYDFKDNSLAYRKAKQLNMLDELFPGWDKLPIGNYKPGYSEKMSIAISNYHNSKK